MALKLDTATEWISEADYLQGKLISKVKHECIDGSVYAMVGAIKNDERIAGNVYGKFGKHRSPRAERMKRQKNRLSNHPYTK